MRIDHIAIWTRDIDRLAAFWREAFGATVGDLYESARQAGFRSRFVTLAHGCRIELMASPKHEGAEDAGRIGYAHLAISLGGTAAVDQAATDLAAHLVAPPRWTGDGYYEAVIQDPDGNLIELTA